MSNLSEDHNVVHVVDDSAAVRDSIGFLVDQVGLRSEKYASASEFLDVVDEKTRGCLVLDVRMPGMSGLDLQDVLRERGIKLPVIIITGHGDVPITVRAMKAGAVEFLQKPFNDQDLLDTINTSIEEYRKIWEQEDHARRVKEKIAGLTPREREVLARLGKGRPNKIIAYEMELSVRTVEGYRASIMSKLGARSIGELMEIVLKAGLEPEKEPD
ncbi:response regulator transcription factor [Thioalkalivibrio sp. ALJ9]|uniref:response regulator transcription factor n=1 Tax=Thioalkalivibrio sp. ALJ9 TaxID=1158758 RepID=UPI00036EFBEF|nr:response regulator [Thioalkalivibrio sp. ALJ9]